MISEKILQEFAPAIDSSLGARYLVVIICDAPHSVRSNAINEDGGLIWLTPHLLSQRHYISGYLDTTWGVANVVRYKPTLQRNLRFDCLSMCSCWMLVFKKRSAILAKVKVPTARSQLKRGEQPSSFAATVKVEGDFVIITRIAVECDSPYQVCWSPFIP